MLPFASPSSLTTAAWLLPSETANATAARVEPAGATIAACLKRASGGSYPRAVSSRQASSSISRNVRLGFGT